MNSNRGSAFMARLGAPGCWRWIVLAAVVLVLPCLTVGFVADDHVLRVATLPSAAMAGFDRGALDLFTFATGDVAENLVLRDRGVFAWWVAPDLKLSFFRPISAATHALDHALWPETSWAMHLHSIAWFGALLVAAHLFYRRIHGGWVGALALLLFALDDARGPVVGWISNRNALIMGTFAIATLWAHHRWVVDGWRPGRVVAPGALALALAAAEGGVAVLGYLVAHAVFVAQGPWRTRVRGAWPLVAVTAAWFLVYKLGGWGTRASGVYLDPGAEPLTYLEHAPARVLVLLVGELALPWSDLWPAYPPRVAPWVLVAGVSTAVVIVALAWPVLATQRLARFHALGMSLAVLPVAATFPADRLLTLVGVGGAGLIAVMAEYGVTSPQARGWRRAGIAALVAYHAFVAPLLLPVRVRSMDGVARTLDVLDAEVGEDAALADQTLVVLHAPSDGMVGFLAFMRASEHRVAPGTIRLLSSGFGPEDVVRVGPRTLRIRPEHGFLAELSNRMQRSDSRPFRADEVIEMPGLRVTVESVTTDGRPSAARFDFDVALEDPSLVWMTWDGARFRPWTPIAIGELQRRPAVDILALAELLVRAPPQDATAPVGR